jgi:hydroxymethylbilane synthase
VALMKLGSRGSPLALAQSHMVAAMLAKASGRPVENFPIQSFTTTGDKVTGRLEDAGGKGLFTKELDEALLDKRIDAAIHSMKDLPTAMPPGIALAAVPAREDPRDGFVSLSARSLADLPPGAMLGTASLRRQAQALHLRPDLTVKLLRGSVQTRLARIEKGDFDATFLAMAGLTRLGLTQHVSSTVAVEDMPPACCQGALAITCREDDMPTRMALLHINQPELEFVTSVERAFLGALDGSCRTPIGGLATLEDGGRLRFIGEVLTADGKTRWRRDETVTLGADAAEACEKMGRRIGEDIRAEAGDAYPITSLRGW